MNDFIASPQEIMIIDDLTRSLTDEENKIKTYIEQFINFEYVSKKIIVALNYRHELIALDGNKLCFAARLAQRNVLCKLMVCDEDYFNAEFIKEAKERNSPLLLKKESRDRFIQNEFEYKDYFDRRNKIEEAKIDIQDSGNISILANLGITFCANSLLFTGMSENTALALGLGYVFKQAKNK